MPRAKAKKQEETTDVAKTTAEASVIFAYKGFDKDLSCRGFKYEVGRTYEHEGRVAACESGFHACENPWDILNYYRFVGDDGSLNRFAVVEQSGQIDRYSDDTKIASAVITIKAELKLPEFIGRAVQWVIDATKGKDADPSGNGARIGSSGYGAQIGSSGNDARIGSSGNGARIGSSGYGAQIGSSGNDARIGSSGNGARIGSSGYGAQIGSSGNGARIGSSGYGARIGSSGYGAQIGSSGYGAQIGSSGYGARIGSSGYGARIGSSGYGAQIGSSGYGARIGSSGNDAQIGSSGNDAQIGSSGNDAQIGSSGNDAQIDATGENAVIASAGKLARAKGKIGTWISLAEFDDNGKCVGFATGCIGQDGLEPDTWYEARRGKLVKAEG